MAISGKVNVITNPSVFFGQVLTGGSAASGFTPLTGQSFGVSMLGIPGIPPPRFDLPAAAMINTSDGSFSLPEFPPSANIAEVTLNLNHMNQPFYRSAPFKYSRAKEGGLNIFLFQPSPVAVTAGTISSALEGASLPGNTVLSVRPWGFNVVGSKEGVDLQFGFRVIAHTGSNLSVFVELAIDGWNIYVGFPADFCTNAHAVRLQIQAALANETGPANVIVRKKILEVFQAPPLSLKADIATQLFNLVSITFSSIIFPGNHNWALSNVNDNTTVMSVHPTIGFPRAF